MTLLPEIPAELRALMAEIGPKWATDTRGHIRLMIERFSDVLQHSPKEGVTVDTIAYGSHERQAFEVFLPSSNESPRPGLIFGSTATRSPEAIFPSTFFTVLFQPVYPAASVSNAQTRSGVARIEILTAKAFMGGPILSSLPRVCQRTWKCVRYLPRSQQLRPPGEQFLESRHETLAELCEIIHRHPARPRAESIRNRTCGSLRPAR